MRHKKKGGGVTYTAIIKYKFLIPVKIYKGEQKKKDCQIYRVFTNQIFPCLGHSLVNCNLELHNVIRSS